jgi:arylsulfatase A-like enzyme
MQGHSMVSLLQGKSPTDWRQSQFYTYWGTPNHYGIRTERYTYLKLAGHPTELFDRETDPDQVHNVAANTKNKTIVERLEKELKKQIREVEISQNELPTSSRKQEKIHKARQ